MSADKRMSFRCRFGIHAYPAWSKPFAGEHRWLQRKTCFRCNKRVHRVAS